MTNTFYEKRDIHKFARFDGIVVRKYIELYRNVKKNEMRDSYFEYMQRGMTPLRES